MGMGMAEEEWMNDIADWKNERMTIPVMLNRKARGEGPH
jgi:hypothetical protein